MRRYVPLMLVGAAMAIAFVLYVFASATRNDLLDSEEMVNLWMREETPGLDT